MENIENIQKRIETSMFGPVVFQIGVETSEIATLFHRVEDAHKRLMDSPLSSVASRLEKEILVSSIYGTNTIEGGTLTEKETENVLQMDPKDVQAEEQKRTLNIKEAYEIALKSSQTPGWEPTIAYINAIHAAITAGLTHPQNQPGKFRDNQKDTLTFVGAEEHGGRYKPPHYVGDIKALMDGLIAWHDELAQKKVPALIRAPLVHLYYELIHPYWDGNGRVGRVLEASILHAAGYHYAPFAMASYYLKHLSGYFTLFNLCRKQAEKGADNPNTPFVKFHLEGQLEVTNRLQDRVNVMVHFLLFEAHIRDLYDQKNINARQYSILQQLLSAGHPIPQGEMERAPWYVSLYLKKTYHTRRRDMKKLEAMKLVRVDAKKLLWPGLIAGGKS